MQIKICCLFKKFTVCTIALATVWWKPLCFFQEWDVQRKKLAETWLLMRSIIQHKII